MNYIENSMDCIVQGVAKSRTQLNDFHFYFSLLTIWKEVILDQHS